MPDCKWCGDSFGNEGAKTNHETYCDEKPPEAGQQDVQQAARADPPQQATANAGAQPPARQEPQQQSQEMQTIDQDAIGVGMQLADSLHGMTSGSPEEKAKAKGELFAAAGSTLASMGQQIAQEEMEGAQRSKNVSQDDLKVADDYVDCPECTGQITNVPPSGEEFQCPHCGVVLIAP